MSVPARCQPTIGLLDLPDRVLTLIASHALLVGPEGVLRSGSRGLHAAVLLARTHPRLRQAAAASVYGLHFGRSPYAWPAARVLSPEAYENLTKLDVTIDRSRFVGFLKWLMFAKNLRVLHLQVVGEPYARDALWNLEKTLLGRLFTRIGPKLESLVVKGVETNALLISACCRCTALTRFEVVHYAPDLSHSSSSSLNICLGLIICFINRGHLSRAQLPCSASDSKSDEGHVLDGPTLSELLENVWSSLWGNYRAGVKEAAVNFPAEAADLASMFQAVSRRMDTVESSMRDALLLLRRIAHLFGSEDIPHAMITCLAQNVRDMTLSVVPTMSPERSWRMLSSNASLRELCIEEHGAVLSPTDVIKLRSSFPELSSLTVIFSSRGGNDFAVPTDFNDVGDALAAYNGLWAGVHNIIGAVCSVFTSPIKRIGFGVAGAQSPVLGMVAARHLSAAEAGIQALSLSLDGCYEFTNMSLIWSRHGESLRQLKIACAYQDILDVSKARRTILVILARYCNPSLLEGVCLPYWMMVDEDVLEQELKWACHVALELPAEYTGEHGCNDILSLNGIQFQKLPQVQITGTFGRLEGLLSSGGISFVA